MTSKNPSNKESEAQRSKGPADQHCNQSQPPVSPTSAELQPPPPPPQHKPPWQKKRDWFDYVKFGAEIIGLGVLIAYTTFAALQWCEMKKATKATQTAAQAAADSVKTTQKQLELSARPWITFRLGVTGPFEFDGKGTAHLKLRITVKNIGHSIAQGINVQAEMFPYSFKQSEFFQPIDRQKKLCDPMRRDVPDEHTPGVTLFPDEEFTQNLGPTISKKEIDGTILPFPNTSDRYIAPMLIGCIDYRFSFATEHHQSGFIYNVYRHNPADPFHGYSIQVNKTLPISRIRLENYFFGGNYAD